MTADTVRLTLTAKHPTTGEILRVDSMIIACELEQAHRPAVLLLEAVEALDRRLKRVMSYVKTPAPASSHD